VITVGSILWPVPITFAIYKGAFVLTNGIMAANKLGGISDPSRWWHWLIFAVLFCVAEIMIQNISGQAYE